MRVFSGSTGALLGMLSASSLKGKQWSHPQVCEFCCRRSYGQYGRGKFRGLFYCAKCWNQWLHREGEWRARKFEVRNALTGEVIDVHPCCTRIYENTTVEWILPRVAAKLLWLASHVCLVVGTTVVEGPQQLRVENNPQMRDETQTFMKHFDVFSPVLTFDAMKMPRPEFFWRSFRIRCMPV